MKRLFLIFTILLCACAAPLHIQTEAATAVPTRATTQWLTIRMVHSGGIMGLMRTVQVSNNGKVTLTDERTKESKTLLLSDVELARLNQLIASADFSVRAPRPDAACADCFIYDIELDLGQGKTFHVQVNDMSIDSSGLGELIAFLRSVIDKGLQS